MVDFTRKIYNTDKFRAAAMHFQKHGVYCFAPVGSSEYIKYWEEEERRSIYGYVADDGDWISGYNYFYLNYCPITRLVKEEYKDRHGNIKTRRVRMTEFPDFYDYDYFYFHAIEEAETNGKHLSVLKKRGAGYSFKGASMLNRNYFLIPNSKSYAIAPGSEYLTRDGILSKAWDIMSFIDDNTAWAKKRTKSTDMHRRAGVMTKDELGNEIEVGYKSEIIGVTLMNDANRARGKRGKLILWEESGSSRDILQAWQIARPSVEEDGVAFGLMIAFGTGGDEESKFDGLKKLFYEPDGYNIQSFDNIWDEHAEGTKCGFFVPVWANMSVEGPDGKKLYMDEHGNSLRDLAVEYVMSERNKVIEGTSDARAIDRYVAENPMTPQEACLELTGNIFPKKDLMAQLAYIRTNRKVKNAKQVGDLVMREGKIVWKIKHGGDITKYPLGKNDDPAGSIVIWEHPVPNAPHGLYIAGCDPYDHDKSGTNSLGSTFIYKRFQSFESYYDVIVAEYTGRPDTAEEYYENVRLLLMYYNARLLYENERKGIFPYFTSKHSDYLLADQPDIINDIISKSNVRRKKGIHMTTQIIDYSEGLVKEWLNTEYAPGHKNLTRILSEPLLEELIQYNNKGNFDRVRALQCLMIYNLQLHNVHVKEAERSSRNRILFDKPIFTDRWFGSTSDANSSNKFNLFNTQ